MLTLKCDIAIKRKGKKNIVRFCYAENITVRTSRDNLTDTAEITAVSYTFWQGRPLYHYIASGDSICIKLGYAEMGNIETVFNGYLKSVETSTKTIIKCENAMRMFKSIQVKAEVIKDFDLKKWVGQYTDVEVVQPTETNFGTISIGKQSLAEALDKIMREFGYLKCYFDDNKLTFVINEEWTDKRRIHVFDPTRNIVNENTTYSRAEDVKIAVKGVHINKDGTKIDYTYPEDSKDHEVRTVLFPYATDIIALKEAARNQQREWTVDRIKGSIKAFGVPFVRKNDIVEIHHPLKKEIDGKRFLVTGVNYEFSEAGYRQDISLGYQIKTTQQQ